MAFSFNSKKRAYVEQYDLKGQLEREWMYYAPKQVFSLLKIYPDGASQVRLKLRSEDDGYPGETEKPNSTTPYTIDGNPNSEAYICHYLYGGLINRLVILFLMKLVLNPVILNGIIGPILPAQVGQK